MAIDPHLFGGALSVGAFVALAVLRGAMRLVRTVVFLALILVGGGVLLGVVHLPGIHAATNGIPPLGR